MENHFEKRTDPTLLLPGAKSVIVLLHNYYPENELPGKDNYKVSKYAYGEDYHFVIKRKLKILLGEITGNSSERRARAFVDSAPVLERAWAREAGLGWIGKNTCLITKEQGSFFFISVIITDLELEYYSGEVPNHCGGCTRCIDACPTNALGSSGLDARKCISYLTIEYRREHLPGEFSGNMDDWIFGCDICQDVCPWNRLSEPHHQAEFNPPEKLMEFDKEDWNRLDEAGFRELFRKSALKRTRYAGLKRNIEFVKKGRETTE